MDEAQAADPKRSRAKMVELNQRALHFYETRDWESAREMLFKALDEAKSAGLDDNNMTARTYVHLGSVYWTGFQDTGAAMRSFNLAKRIRPDIQVTPAIETPDLKQLFELSAGEDEPSPPPAKETASPPSVDQPPSPRPRVAVDEDSGEPPLPSSMSAPLMCTLPAVVPPNRSLTIRCALDPKLSGSVVRMQYRPRGMEGYVATDMRHTPRGWYIVTLAATLMKEGSLQVYFDALDETGNPIASLARSDSPSVIAIRKGGLRGSADDDDPMERIRAIVKAERYVAGLHRRREGSLWFGFGSGVGWGYVPAGRLEWQPQVKVSALTTSAGMLHFLPELGYMVSDSFGLALQGRIELLRQEQAYYTDRVTGERVQLAANLSGAPATKAAAAFVRAIGYADISRGGNLRFTYSGDIGAGFVRFPVKPSAVVNYDAETDTYLPDYSRTIAKTDTRPVGVLLVGASMGLAWNLSRHFAIALNARALTGVPDWGVVVEGALSAQLGFGGKQGGEQPTAESEDDSIGGHLESSREGVALE